MKLLIPFIFLLASCGASHKLKQSERKILDSAGVTTRDTAHVSQEENSSSNVTAQDVHVIITFPPEEQSQAAQSLQESQQHSVDRSAMSLPKKTGNRVVDAIQDAISAAGSAGRLPATVKIDIGSISDSSTRTVKKDSGAAHVSTKAQVHKDEESKSKEVTREGMPLSARIGLWMLIIAVAAAVVYRYRAKFILLKAFIVKLLNIK